MTDREIEDRMRKFKKRGFITDGTRERCDSCGENGVWIYKLMSSRIGGRDIRWCLACSVVKSWRRTSDDELVEDKSFDIEAFLA